MYAVSKRILLSVCLFLALAPTPMVTMARHAVNSTQTITATSVAYPVNAVKDGKIGALTFEEGWELGSARTGFGGFSGLALLGNRKFLLVSDTGNVARFTLRPDGKIENSSIKPIPDGPGSANNKLARDMESLVASPDGDIFWVGFEQANAVWKYSARSDAALANARPKKMRFWSGNRGPESMTQLDGGRFLILSENVNDDPRGKRALLFASDPTEAPDAATPFFYDSQGKGMPTDVQQLPDGRVLILHRDFSVWKGFVSTLAVADVGAIRKNYILRSQAIARFASPQITENFEGITLVREGSKLKLWLLSDDNLMGFQRTLLMKYEIDPAKLPRKNITSQPSG